jgi:hypothetical protein
VSICLPRRLRLPALVLVTATIVLGFPAGLHGSSDLRVEFTALQQLLADQVFTTDGRRYVKGTKDSRCNYAYLEHPVVDGVDGRLRIRARFSGKSALDLFGKCVGFGDDFDVTVTAVPYYQNAALRLKDVRVETGATGFYSRRVCSSLATSLQSQFAYPVQEEVRRALEDSTAAPGYRRSLTRFDVRQLTVSSDALTLSIDMQIVVTGKTPPAVNAVGPAAPPR